MVVGSSRELKPAVYAIQSTSFIVVFRLVPEALHALEAVNGDTTGVRIRGPSKRFGGRFLTGVFVWGVMGNAETGGRIVRPFNPPGIGP